MNNSSDKEINNMKITLREIAESFKKCMLSLNECQESISKCYESIGKLKELEKEDNNVNNIIEKHKD